MQHRTVEHYLYIDISILFFMKLGKITIKKMWLGIALFTLAMAGIAKYKAKEHDIAQIKQHLAIYDQERDAFLGAGVSEIEQALKIAEQGNIDSAPLLRSELEILTIGRAMNAVNRVHYPADGRLDNSKILEAWDESTSGLERAISYIIPLNTYAETLWPLLPSLAYNYVLLYDHQINQPDADSEKTKQKFDTAMTKLATLLRTDPSTLKQQVGADIDFMSYFFKKAIEYEASLDNVETIKYKQDHNITQLEDDPNTLMAAKGVFENTVYVESLRCLSFQREEIAGDFKFLTSTYTRSVHALLARYESMFAEGDVRYSANVRANMETFLQRPMYATPLYIPPNPNTGTFPHLPYLLQFYKN